MISDAVKVARPDEAPFPAGLYSEAAVEATDPADEVPAEGVAAEAG